MIRTSFKIVLINYSGLQNFRKVQFRCLRAIGRRGNGPKRMEGEVKTVTCYDERERIETYSDLIESIQKSNLGNELEVEKTFANEDEFGDAIERCDQFSKMHLGEEKLEKSVIKKNIIKRKYFKLDKETNLLTHAAKEQIRFLHKSNPLEWNCKAIAECFPVSEAGVKKLLKSNFTQTCPEKIKAHDEDVAEKWKSLKSGKFSTFITPLTQKLYKEGKLIDDYFSGNPNLPTRRPTQKVIRLDKKKVVGEFSAIVQTYANYDKQKVLESGQENCSEKRITRKHSKDVEIDKNIDIKAVRKLKYAQEEFEDENTQVNIFSSKKKLSMDDADLPFSQFKEILKEENEFLSSNRDDYDDILSNKPKSQNSLQKANNQQYCFLKIDKYDKNKNIDVMYDTEKHMKHVYKYDEKLGYQHPTGKVVKGYIQIPSNVYEKGKLYKVGQYVYDDNGEFLYKVPG